MREARYEQDSIQEKRKGNFFRVFGNTKCAVDETRLLIPTLDYDVEFERLIEARRSGERALMVPPYLVRQDSKRFSKRSSIIGVLLYFHSFCPFKLYSFIICSL